jgi:uncharacterized protein YjbI with pentapeptide repeats
MSGDDGGIRQAWRMVGGVVLTEAPDRDRMAALLASHRDFAAGRPGGVRVALKFHDLSGIDLSGQVLAGADFTGASLQGAQLSGCDLSAAILFGANLQEATLDDALLIGADLRGAMLGRAHVARADLTRADLREGALFTNRNGGFVRAHSDPRSDGSERRGS